MAFVLVLVFSLVSLPRMVRKALTLLAATLTICLSASTSIAQQTSRTAAAGEVSAVPSRVVRAVNDASLVQLRGNTPPSARPLYDQGMTDAQLPMNRMMLILRRSPEQETALSRFMAEQQDPTSSNFHHWLSPEEFGKLYGPSDADIAAITAWLQNQGFRVDNVSKGRVTIEFSGTAGQVNSAFHTEMHRYLVRGVEHTSNDRDPQIPEALSPVITGIASLHNFFPAHQSIRGASVRRDQKTGKITPVVPAATGTLPQFTYTDNDGNTREDITPYDFATIYNVLPLWNAGINGKGQTIAISGASDISLSDIATFQSSFGLPSNPPTIIHNGADPGEVSGAQGENTLDVEWSGAVAPQAKIALVVSGSTQTTFGGQLSNAYIVDNKVAPVMSASYGECELYLGSAGNAAYNNIYQQGAAEGISIFESAGDQGSAGCESQDTPAPNAAQTGLQVNGLASSPYLTAVGGTDFLWQNNPIATYWNSTNAANGSTAKGYIPEIPWNSTCASTYLVSLSVDANGAAFCNDVYNQTHYSNLGDLVVIAGGSGGVSACTNPSGTTPSTCAGGYAKPSWQTGTGVPSDGKRDLPDVSLFASAGYPDGLVGSAYLFCESSDAPGGSCNYSNPNDIIYQEVGGTSVSSPAMAGIMALVVQKTGSAQGLANPTFYKLAAAENLATCNSNTVAAGNSCVFYDTTSGLNGQVCAAGTQNCVLNNAGDQLGVLSGYSTNKGYDLATGLGSVNATNLVNSWSATTATPVASVSPLSLTFSGTTVGQTSAAQVVTLKNTGSTPLTIALADTTISGSGASSFSQSTNCASTLAAGSSCTFSVSFAPAAAGAFTASLNISTNATGSTTTVSLTGTGTAASASTTLTLSLSPSSVTYGQAASVTASLSGSPAPTGTISYTVDGGATQSANVSGGMASLSLGMLTAGTHSVAATYNGSTSYKPASQSLSISIAKAVLTATAANLSRNYGAANPPLTYAVTGFVRGDTSAVISGTATLATTATSTSAPGTYPITFSSESLSASNYTFTYVAGTLTVSGGASQTITFGALSSQVYGATPITLHATASSGLPVSYTATGPATISGSTLTITGAGSVTVTATQPGNSNYAAAPSVSQSFSVAKAALSATAASLSRQYGAGNPTLTYTVTGFVNGDTTSVVTGTATLSTTATSTSPVGTYPITFATENLAAANYTITYVAGTLTISGGASQTITFGALSNQTYGAGPITLSATASSGLAVTYTVTGPATISGAKLSIVGAGSVTVTASQAGNGTYAAAPSVSRSFTVAKAVLTASVVSVSRQYGAANPSFTFTVAGFVNGDTSGVISGSAALTTTANSTSPAGTYPITFATEALAATNYTFTYVPGTLTVTAASVVLPPTFNPAGGTYSSAQVVTLSDGSSGATVYYTTNGSTPGAGSTIYTAPIQVAASETIEAVAILNGVASTVSTATYIINSAQCTTINYANGFTSTGLTLNGGAAVKNGLLQLTDGGAYEARSAFYTTLVPVNNSTIDFTFQLTNPAADGITFAIQSSKPQALGSYGSGLGYAGIAKSAAIKFDLYNNSGEGTDSTGLYLNGAVPTTPSVSLAPAGIDLHSGHIFAVHITYANAMATASITDTVTHATASTTAAGDLTQVVGTSAYFGFTGATGALSATQNILTWSYSGGPGCAVQ